MTTTTTGELVCLVFIWGATGDGSIGRAQSAGSFQDAGQMTRPREGHTATLLTDGKVLIAGGYDRHSDGRVRNTATAELYDPATRTFVETGDLLVPHGAHTATLLPDGQVLIVGGFHGSSGFSPIAAAELYDPSTGAFRAAGYRVWPCSSASATLLPDGRVFLAGGEAGEDLNGDVRPCAAELYDPATGKFRLAGGMSTVQRNPTATLLADGTVLVATVGLLPSAFLPAPTAEVYEPSLDGFRQVGQSNPAFAQHAAALLADGRVLLTGGQVPDALMRYDPATHAFDITRWMNGSRAWHSSTPLADGQVLIAGGVSGWSWSNETVKAAELYDPITGAFVPAGKMKTGRVFHTATLLNTGEVLFTGGWSMLDPRRLTSEASAELYRPAVLARAPELLTVSEGERLSGAILHAATHRLVSRGDPAVAGEALEVYLTGLTEGSINPPQVAMGGRLAEVLWFGNGPGFAGLNQINVRVPEGLAHGGGESRVWLMYRGRTSNEVSLSVR